MSQASYDPSLDPEALLSPKEAGALLSVSSRYLEKLRHAGKGPAFIRLAVNRVRYRRRDLLAFAESLEYVPNKAA